MARVGVLTTSYPRHPTDPAGAFVRGMARALAARGHELEVLAPAPADPAEALRDPGVTLRWVRYAPSGLARTFYGAGVPDNVRSDPRAWPGLATFPIALAREARRRGAGWDAIVSHWGLPCGLIASELRGRRRHLAVLHSADVHLLGRMPGRGLLTQRLARGADALVFSSAALRRQLLSWLPSVLAARVGAHSHAQAMGIDPIDPSAGRRALRRRLKLGSFAVLSLGRLVPIKGLSIAVRALEGIEGAELLVAGEGPRERALRELAAARGVATRFLGVVSGQAKADLLHAAHAFVTPSLQLPSGRAEGTPTAILEAARAGLAIVASDVGGIGEVLTHDRSALLVPPGDPDAMRTALQALRADGRLRRRIGRAAQTVGKRHEWPAVAPMFESLLLGR